MNSYYFTLMAGLWILSSCQSDNSETNYNTKPEEKALVSLEQTQDSTTDRAILHTSGRTIHTRFLAPKGYSRVAAKNGSFANYLRQLELKPEGSLVKYYDGKSKPNPQTYAAVVNLPIGNKNLHQCADAIMRLRADYLWKQQKYEQIHFNFTNGFRVDYEKWKQGYRIEVNGNSTSWKKTTEPSDSYANFWNYMEQVFMYAGTLSLSRELKPVPIDSMQIGDVFIQGGSPGHAVIVVDKAMNPQTKDVLYMLAQSYMPAQEIQILHNPSAPGLSPWYRLDPNQNIINTPEWDFRPTDLKRFESK